MIAAAVGFASGTGEIFGAGVGPPIAGYVADRYGIQNILYVSLVGLLIGNVVALLLRETAPRKLNRLRAVESSTVPAVTARNMLTRRSLERPAMGIA